MTSGAASGRTASGSPCSAPPTPTATSSTGTTSRTRSTTTPRTTTSGSPRSRRWSRRCAKKFRKRGPVLLLDAGDTIQGTPLAYYYARIAPITAGGDAPDGRGDEHDATTTPPRSATTSSTTASTRCAPSSRSWTSRCSAPTRSTRPPSGRSSRRTSSRSTASARAASVKVGILGLVTPGVAIWDKANVEGKIEFPGLVEQAASIVPELKKQGCDLVIVSAHSGADTSSSYGDALPYPENAASLVAEQVPGIDAILVGHAHKEIPQRFVTNATTGKQVLLSEPLLLGHAARGDGPDRRVAPAQAELEAGALARPAAQLQHRPRRTARSPRRSAPSTTRCVAYVNAPIGTSTAAMSAARAVVEDVPIIDFVHYVQAEAVKAGLTGADAAAAGAVDRRAVQPDRVVPGRRGQRARRRRALHLRQHPARR